MWSSQINCENKPGLYTTVHHYTPDCDTKLVKKAFPTWLINLLGLNCTCMLHVYAAWVRRSDVPPVAASVRKGRHCSTVMSPLPVQGWEGWEGARGGRVWQGGKKRRSAKLSDKGQKKSRVTIAGVNPQSKPPQLTQLCAAVIVCWPDQQTWSMSRALRTKINSWARLTAGSQQAPRPLWILSITTQKSVEIHIQSSCQTCVSQIGIPVLTLLPLYAVRLERWQQLCKLCCMDYFY